MTLKIHLSDEEKSALIQLERRSPDWRVRQRSKIILLIESGCKSKDIMKEMDICTPTFYSTLHAWVDEKFDSLSDKKRAGAPSKISPEALQKILQKAEEQPLTAVQLLEVHLSEGGTPVHLNTLCHALRRAGFVFKRTRASLKKKK